jgi:hypothetical protein
MLDRVSIAWRIGFALIWEAICLWLYANTFNEYWPFVLGVTMAAAAICLGHFGKAVMAIIEAFRALWQSPETQEYQHTVDGVRAAALNIHCWVSRNIAAAIGCGTILALWIAPEPLEFMVGAVGFVAIPAATHWPAIARRFREWGTKLEAAE